MPVRNKSVFLGWVPFWRRTEMMQPFFQYEMHYVSFHFPSRYLRPLEYLCKTAEAVFYLLRKRPKTIWVQLPPTPLLHIAHFYRRLFDRNVRIIADCHTGVFLGAWAKTPGLASLLSQSDVVLVHNENNIENAKQLGIPAEKISVLETKPTDLVLESAASSATGLPSPWILHPCSFKNDEPLAEVLKAAAQMPEITLAISGNVARAKGLHDLSNVPANVKFVGFLPKSEYDRLLASCDAVLGLTLFDGIQLSVANEGVGAGKPIVISDTPTLRKLFDHGVIYVESQNPTSIASGCREAIARKAELQTQIAELKQKRNERWMRQAEAVAERIA